MEGRNYLQVNAELRAKGCLAAAGFTIKNQSPLNPTLSKGDFLNPPLIKGVGGVVYLFDNWWTRTYERLAALERDRDHDTIRGLEAIGIAADWLCLEIGGGGGSSAANRRQAITRFLPGEDRA